MLPIGSESTSVLNSEGTPLHLLDVHSTSTSYGISGGGSLKYIQIDWANSYAHRQERTSNSLFLRNNKILATLNIHYIIEIALKLASNFELVVVDPKNHSLAFRILFDRFSTIISFAIFTFVTLLKKLFKNFVAFVCNWHLKQPYSFYDT